jgi:uncharacterized membrane protein/protein-disulfide isomerase
MSSRVRWLIVACASAGLGLSGAALLVHYRLLTDPSYISPCDINATFNCSAAYLSRYGSIAGVPTALGGVLWFGIVLLVALGATPTDRDSAGASYLAALTWLAVPVVLFLGYASYAQLRTGCPICMGVYACVLAILALTIATKGVPMRELPSRLAGDLAGLRRHPIVLVLALVLLGGVGAAAALFPREGQAPARTASSSMPDDARAAFTDVWAKQPRLDLGMPSDGAKVLIVKFNDFECTTCRSAETFYAPIIDRLNAAQPGTVKVVFKDWVWNSKCNPHTSSTIPGHEASCEAAVAARVARDQGKYDEMKTWLFAHQGVTPEAVRAQATQMLGIQDFDREYAIKMKDIQQDIADGAALQIAGTPTYFINGVRIPSARLIAPEYFELAIQLELKRASAPPQP